MNQVWKAKMMQTHPDKNRGNEAAATINAQRCNAARDVLLNRVNDPFTRAAERKVRLCARVAA